MTPQEFPFSRFCNILGLRALLEISEAAKCLPWQRERPMAAPSFISYASRWNCNKMRKSMIGTWSSGFKIRAFTWIWMHLAHFVTLTLTANRSLYQSKSLTRCYVWKSKDYLSIWFPGQIILRSQYLLQPLWRISLIDDFYSSSNWPRYDNSQWHLTFLPQLVSVLTQLSLT